EEITSQGRTRKERRQDFNASRIKRVANGSGHKEHEVKELINKFAMMRQMMMQIGVSSGLLGKIPGLKNLAQMRKFMGLDLKQMMGAAAPVDPDRKVFRPGARNEDRAKQKKKRKEARKQRKKSRRK
ncbi:MAG: signal recognition particle protein, partial [Deltaproteobacteria bacterium]|nr:signal recognition particle protein [Deltaproteobacteria bacterium]